jgi:uncharacterized protein YybS (DUF2232 family)
MSLRRSPADAGASVPPAVLRSSTNRPPTRGLTEGAILAGLTAVVAAAGLVIPPIGILLAPLPLMLLVIRWGMRTGVLAGIVASLILLQFFGPLMALSGATIFAPIGLTLGWGVRRGSSAQITILAGSAAFLGSMLAGVALAYLVLHQNILGQLIQVQIKGFQMAMGPLERLGAPQQQLDDMRLLFSPYCGEHHCFVPIMQQFLQTVFPTLLALAALFWTFLCYTVGRSVLRRIGHEIPQVPGMLTWRLSPQLAMGLLWTSAALSVVSLWVPQLAGVVLNAVILNLFLFAFLGVLVGIAWMTKWHFPRLVQVIAVMFVITAQTLLPILALAILGMLDTWYDYRRLTRPQAPAGAQQ